MKIEKSSKPLPLTPGGEGQVRASTSKSAQSASSGSSSSTNANLSAASTQPQSMESTVVHTPLVDSAKVAEIKQAISENRFQVNSSAVADSLIKSVSDLIESQKH